MTQLHAQPYDISASGFYFESFEEYTQKATKAVNDYGDPVEEFEIQFIDGEHIDCEFASAWNINQASIGELFKAVDDWGEQQKIRHIIAVGECGYSHDQLADDPDAVDLTIYEMDSLKELAEQFLDEGFFGEIPTPLQNYIDLDAIARDLAIEYSETTIAGQRLIYLCG